MRNILNKCVKFTFRAINQNFANQLYQKNQLKESIKT